MDTPPVVCEYIEYAENENEESSRPFCFESHGDHDTCCKAEYGDEYTNNRPFALNDEAEEEENKENATSKEEANR